MKTVRLALVVLLLAAPTACALFTADRARTALDVAHIVCLLGQAESDDATIARICGIEEGLYPEMRRILEAQRVASRRFAAAHASDAGAP
ncbi:hypothetical protein LZC95_08115 [Pendulispora brunnea]|uniref:Secreted protein n=1 Tax=Pendulispora brunnea TaxID=2905690 RepID=A0ABZ2KIB1_9BACT